MHAQISARALNRFSEAALDYSVCSSRYYHRNFALAFVPADLELCLEYLETSAWAPCESASRWLQRLRTSSGVFFKLDTKAPLPLSFEPASA